MIQLVIEKYCENCPDFDPYCEKDTIYAGMRDAYHNTNVYCKHKERCEVIADFIRDKMYES